MTRFDATIQQIEDQLEAERHAIKAHKVRIRNVMEIVSQFDGKVMNKRFTDKVTEVAHFHTWFVGLNMGIQSHLNAAVTIDRGKYVYPEYFREMAIHLVLQEDGKRLDAERTLVSMQAQLEQLDLSLENYQYDHDATVKYAERMEQIELEIEYLKKNTHNVIKESFRRHFYYIK